MKRILCIALAAAVLIIGIAVIKQTPAASALLWEVSGQGAWLLPLVLVSSLLDSVHPCSFSILLVTIAFLFGLQMTRGKIMAIGGAYVFGIFVSYLLIGLGALKVLHLFNTPHFMGKLGATILITFGVINLLNVLFPRFPIRLKIPSVSHTAMGTLMEKASIPAAFGLGILVGVCQFPCMGGPYLMVIGLLRDQVTYAKGFLYLVLYNLILILPLAAVLWIASEKSVLERLEIWKREHMKQVRLWAGIAMIAIGALILIF